MKVTVNKPAPVVTPPATFDLIGLTQEEILALRSILARRSPSSLAPLEPLRRQIYAVTNKLDQPFTTDGRYSIQRKLSIFR